MNKTRAKTDSADVAAVVAVCIVVYALLSTVVVMDPSFWLVLGALVAVFWGAIVAACLGVVYFLILIARPSAATSIVVGLGALAVLIGGLAFDALVLRRPASVWGILAAVIFAAAAAFVVHRRVKTLDRRRQTAAREELD